MRSGVDGGSVVARIVGPNVSMRPTSVVAAGADFGMPVVVATSSLRVGDVVCGS